MKKIQTIRSYARYRQKALDQMKPFFRENDKLGRYQIFIWKIAQRSQACLRKKVILDETTFSGKSIGPHKSQFLVKVSLIRRSRTLHREEGQTRERHHAYQLHSPVEPGLTFYVLSQVLWVPIPLLVTECPHPVLLQDKVIFFLNLVCWFPMVFSFLTVVELV